MQLAARLLLPAALQAFDQLGEIGDSLEVARWVIRVELVAGEEGVAEGEKII